VFADDEAGRSERNRMNVLSMDKTAFSIARLDDEPDDRRYWAAKTPHERLEALEFLRQAMYGYDPSSARLQRVLTTSQLAGS
jgi:hypothetical protein